MNCAASKPQHDTLHNMGKQTTTSSPDNKGMYQLVSVHKD